MSDHEDSEHRPTKKSVHSEIFSRFPLLLTLLLIGVASLWWLDHYVSESTQNLRFQQWQTLPDMEVGLLLGTRKHLSNGRINRYYQYRIQAAVLLYQNGKIKRLLVSGDNGTRHYDETTTMTQDLIQHGIPARDIVQDYAGFRTLDSVVRAKEVFGLTQTTIISQPFHNARALFIARQKGLHAVAFDARNVSGMAGWTVQFREKLARVKMMLDLLFHVQPKFLLPPDTP